QGDLQPDLTLLFDAPVEIGLSRMNVRGDKDRIEKEKIDFFERVRAVYLTRAKQFTERFKIIDATQSVESVEKQIHSVLGDLLIASENLVKRHGQPFKLLHKE
ncbi:MAG: dTMP kinase, partial [Gammaproteobacteria bacterium]|nr:dTMP kinase [Gammaproteobacteria bacterium]